ncbi:MAG: alanine racemase [Candidatus Ventricola sp.]
MHISYEEAISRCWAEVDLSQLVQNYRSAQALLRGGAQLICVLKADAYGLGAKAAAQRLWQEGQRLFAVASYNEAAQLLRVLPQAQVLILGLCGRAQLKPAIESGMLLTVFTRQYAQSVIAAAKEAGVQARVHVKIETGLNRIGLLPKDAPEVVQGMQESGVVALEGLFTHLALRDKDSDRAQLDRLMGVRDALAARGVRIPMVHALDSIGMVRYPEEQMDAVRTGAWLYGVCPRGYAHPEKCRLTMTVKTRIAQLHRVCSGECLGYDETHPVARDSVVATLSAGYVDGYPRQNSCGEVEIRGRRAPVVGLVCMDQMMVDVTDIPEACEGDEVILLGGSIGVDEYADWAGLNRNESLARTGRRVPRVYLESGQVVGVTEAME